MNAYPSYNKYKPSNVDWLGEIPEHWEVIPLKYLLREKLKYGANELAIDEDETQPRFVRITDISDDGTLRPDTFKSIDIQIAKEYLLTENDLLFARSGATVGKTFLYQKSWGVTAFAGYLIRARFSLHKTNSKFIFFCTRSSFYWQWIKAATIQATIQNVSAEKYASFCFPLPPLSEQQKIADFLDRETAKIDSLIKKRNDLIKLLQEKRSAVISHAVTKGIDPTVRLKPSNIDWLGEIPEHWEVKPLKYEISINDNVLSESTNPLMEFDYIDIGGVSFDLGIVSKQHYVFEDAPSRARRKVKAGNVIVSTVRTYLRAIAFISPEDERCIVSTGFAVLCPKKIHSKYLSFFCLTAFFIENVVSRSTGVSYPAINAGEIGNISVVIPPLSEQQKIADFLDRETAKIDSLIKKEKKIIKKMKEYRTALISAAVTGKIDVRGEEK